MTAQRIFGLILVVVFALLAAVFVSVAMTPPKDSETLSGSEKLVEKTASQRVLLSRRDIPAGRFIDQGDLTWGEVEVSGYNWISSDEYSLTQFPGSVAVTDIKAGTAIAYDALVRPQQQGFLAAVLQPGMRAVSVPINDVAVVAGLIGPGDYVDLLLTFYADSDRGAWSMRQGGDINMLTNKTLATGVRVIAINQRSVADLDKEIGDKITTATVEVSPKVAQRLALASHMGSLSMTLRSQRSPGDSAEKLELWGKDVHSVSDQLKPKPGLVLMRGSQTQVVGFTQRDDNTTENTESSDDG